jgi:superfamily I DNA and/or RNA helicase
LTALSAFAARGVTLDRVAVLTPYRAHAASVAAILRHQFSPCPAVSTIDAFQGRASDVVILLAVLPPSSTPAGPSLLSDSRRVNVALTRARQKLVLIAAASIISPSTSPLLAEAADVAQNRDYAAYIDLCG